MISSARIGYVRSFNQPQEIEFSLPDGTAARGYNALVGKNNSGKTTFARYLRAMTAADSSITIGYEDRHTEPPEVSIAWRSENETIEIALNATASKSVFQRSNDALGAGQRFRYIPSRRPFTSEFNYFQPLAASEYERNDYSNRRLNYQMYFDSHLAQALASSLSEDETRTAILNVLRDVDESLSEIDVDNVAGKDVIRFRSASGRWHLISDTGDGTTNLIRIAHALGTLAEKSCVVIDEPELSLHPQLQKRLHEVLISFSQHHQIIVLTHSPHFVSWEDLSEGGRLARTYLDHDGYSRIATAQTANLARIRRIAANNITNRKYFDSVAKELFFSDAAVLVEGPDDVHYISNWVKSTGATELPLMGYGCGGFSAIPAWADLCIDMGIRCVELFDGDQREAFDAECIRLGSKYPDAVCFLLSRDDIRDKYARDDAGRETDRILVDGIFRRNGAINDDAQRTFEMLLQSVRSALT